MVPRVQRSLAEWDGEGNGFGGCYTDSEKETADLVKLVVVQSCGHFRFVISCIGWLQASLTCCTKEVVP